MAMTPDDDASHETMSLTESAYRYPVEHGRTYHKYHEGLYPFPNDEQELDRFDLLHHLWKQVNEDRLYLAPLQDPKRILDVGTGSGIWPIEMANIFPDTSITGIDLSPVQPTEVPPNVYFFVEDATEEWLWESNYFDYIHLGNMVAAIPSSRHIIQQAMKVLKPGGWLEWHEVDPEPRCDDGSVPPPATDGKFSEYALHDWMELGVRAAEEYEPHRQVFLARHIADEMRSEGYVDVTDRVVRVPMSPWPKDRRLKVLGAWNQENWLKGLSAYTYKPFASLGWTKAEVEVFLVSVRKSIGNRHYHAYQNFHIVTAMKPLPGGRRSPPRRSPPQQRRQQQHEEIITKTEDEERKHETSP